MHNDLHDPATPRMRERVVHVHIPKTAGMAVTEAFRTAYGDRFRLYPIRFESQYGQIGYDGFNFFGGHVGYKAGRRGESCRSCC